MAKDTVSYGSPFYDELIGSTEQKLGLPVGLLSSIVKKGERSNADQVSSAGAKSVFQIIPATRDAALKKYGIDAYLSPENAAEVSGLLLKEGIARNKGDVSAAVSEYHGGTNRDNWGPLTKAYTNRVMVGQNNSKLDALSAGFAKFMANNQAQSPAPVAQPAMMPKDDALSAGFGQWLETQKAPPANIGDLVPRDARPDGTVPAALPMPAALPDPTLAEKMIGSGEAALTMATGLTTGALGMANGMVSGAVNNLTNGAYGTPGGVEESMGKGAESGTYIPRTRMGQEYAAEMGKTLESTLPAMPLTAELGALGRGATAAMAGARDLTAGSAARVRIAAPAITERVERVLRRNPDPSAPSGSPTPTPGTLGSGGSAGTDVANLRTANASNLPVPVKLTEGQATRDFNQLRFENETAKSADGAAIRDRYSDQNKAIQDNFEAWVDQTGKTTPDVIATGKAVDKVLMSELARDKAEVRTKYTEASKSPEAVIEIDPGEVVSIGQGEKAIQESPISYLNSKPSGLATTALADHAKAYAVKLGVAEKAADGTLIPKKTDVKTMEAWRKEISQVTDYEKSSIRDSTILKGLIDAQTEPVAGPLYRDARRARELQTRKWENRSIVSDLVNNKRGTDDRKVAIGDVFDHVILNGDRSELSHVRAVLQRGGEEGKQAWRELQGETVEWIKSEALKNVATDQRGQRIVSPAQLERAIMKLDKKGKLDFVFGKQGAQQMRDISDLTKVVFTTPPGTVNTSNTAGVLMAALTEAGITGSITGLPVPVLSGLRLISNQVKHKKLLKKIDHALNNRNRAIPPQPSGF